MATDDLNNKENQSTDDSEDRKLTNDYHPDAEISEENKIIEGDKVMNGGETPQSPKKKINYLIILFIIVAVIVIIVWSMRGCDRSSDQGYVYNFINQILWYC